MISLWFNERGQLDTTGNRSQLHFGTMRKWNGRLKRDVHGGCNAGTESLVNITPIATLDVSAMAAMHVQAPYPSLLGLEIGHFGAVVWLRTVSDLVAMFERDT